MIGKDFTPIIGNEVLILANGVVKAVKYVNAHINAVACQTNNEVTSKTVNCNYSFNDLKMLDAHFVACTEDCSKQAYEDLPLFGGPV